MAGGDETVERLPESPQAGNEERLAALRATHGHLPKEDFVRLAADMNIALPPGEVDDPGPSPHPVTGIVPKFTIPPGPNTQ